VPKQRRKTRSRPAAGLDELRKQLESAEATLGALRAGEVDALVVTRGGAEQVITLQGADLPYRILLDQMYAGAVTLTPDGVIVYCNARFADIVRVPFARILGSRLVRFVAPAEQRILEDLFERAGTSRVEGDLEFRRGDGTPVPVSVTFAPLRLTGGTPASGVIGVVVDATERKQQEKLLAQLIQDAMTAQDEERRRIARELHDETGQSLTALLVGLRTIEGSPTMGEAGELARRLRTMVARTLDEVGRLSRGLHPTIVDDVGLAAALTSHAQDFAARYSLPVDVRIEGTDGVVLSPLLQSTVYRILQESLTNVARHAEARSVRVRLVCREATVELRVEDDGVGFTPNVTGVPVTGGRRGLGLRGMWERAALLGGSVEVESRPGAGAAITARFPLRGG
jgi:PAS domain S-box-containing protein